MVSPLCVYKISQKKSFCKLESCINYISAFAAKGRNPRSCCRRGLTGREGMCYSECVGRPPGCPFFTARSLAPILLHSSLFTIHLICALPKRLSRRIAGIGGKFWIFGRIVTNLVLQVVGGHMGPPLRSQSRPPVGERHASAATFRCRVSTDKTENKRFRRGHDPALLYWLSH